MAQDTQTSDGHLSLWDTVSIIIGIVIGAGIYETAPMVFSNVGSPVMALGVWVLGGALSLIGALCYAELASTYPRSGGDYVYLSRAFGSWAGFLFGWAQLAVIMTGSIGMMAYIFANYASQLWNIGSHSMFFYAFAVVVILSATNMAGAMFGKRAQNILTVIKVLGLLGILFAGFFWAKPETTVLTTGKLIGGTGSIGLAMVLVLYTYGGWNDAAYVAAEVKNKRRNIPRALILGTAALAAIYVLVNWAYLAAVGFESARNSTAIAADVLAQPLGVFGARAMSLLVMVSALGAVNGLIYTGARIYSTLGEDFRMFSKLARWNQKRNSPVTSLATQGVITLAMITLVGTQIGQGTINLFFVTAGATALNFSGYSAFEMLLRCTAPVFWLFFLLTGISLFILRAKDRNIERPFSVPLYPVLPLVFCATCVYMLYSAANYAGKLTWLGAAPLFLGFVLYLFSTRSLGKVPGQVWAPKTQTQGNKIT
ncbi:MAG: amino acid permease [Verrucomicrobia bacterium]|nr:amino acid permease [Verrucomicrobiota bacterium]